MADYHFDIVQADGSCSLSDRSVLHDRPFVENCHSLKRDAELFVPGQQLATAINTALAVGDPLLLTGEAGTGKTQTAYFLAHRLQLDLIHFQVKSESTAKDLLYRFDSVKYFHDANVGSKEEELDKSQYVEFDGLGKAIKESNVKDLPTIVLVDEIDKAPRDFPNDLLRELDQMEFTVTETGEPFEAKQKNRPIVVITSNSERRLPEPFLRRCVYHHIKFDERLVRQAVERRTDSIKLSPELRDLAIKRFLNLRSMNLRKVPATGELLVWLQVLGYTFKTQPEEIERRLNDPRNLDRLPHLSVLLKDRQDAEDVKR